MSSSASGRGPQNVSFQTFWRFKRDSLQLHTAATGFAGISTDAALPLYLAASALSRVFKFSSPSLRTDLLAKGAAPPRRRGPRQGPYSPSLPRPYIPEPHTSGGSGTLEGSRARLYSQEKRNKQPPLASKIRSAGFSLFLGPKRGGREREKKRRRHRCVHLTRSRPHYQGNHLCQAACLLSLLVAIGGLL